MYVRVRTGINGNMYLYIHIYCIIYCTGRTYLRVYTCNVLSMPHRSSEQAPTHLCMYSYFVFHFSFFFFFFNYCRTRLHTVHNLFLVAPLVSDKFPFAVVRSARNTNRYELGIVKLNRNYNRNRNRNGSAHERITLGSKLKTVCEYRGQSRPQKQFPSVNRYEFTCSKEFSTVLLGL